MRLKLHFELKSPNIPLDNRPFILSYLKNSINNYEQKLYQDVYENGVTPKKYTFSIWLANPDFKEDTILLQSNKMNIQFSTGDSALGIQMYNAFLKMRNVEFPIPFGNSILLKKISAIPEKIIATNKIRAKFISPLVVRNHSRDNDYYYSVDHPDFIKELYKTAQYQLEILKDLPVSLLNNFSVTPIQPKKGVVQFYGQKMGVSLGEYEFIGEAVLLDYFYKYGIGSRRSSGFGMIEI